MKFSSPAFKNGESIPSKHTCDGENARPELVISDVPREAMSLVIVMEDPDVPEFVRKDRMWDHWVQFNIPPTTLRIPEKGEVPGISGKNTSEKLGYQGPCPPDREHRYVFTLYALDKTLSLNEGSSKKEVEAAMQGHILAKTELIGRYERTKK